MFGSSFVLPGFRSSGPHRSLITFTYWQLQRERISVVVGLRSPNAASVLRDAAKLRDPLTSWKLQSIKSWSLWRVERGVWREESAAELVSFSDSPLNRFSY